uniref:DUF4216 domain-containing protein n=1 Tax=Davidia involucrata TaxID=16924 RepID=A0A5B7BH02_DAVIN
MFAKWFGDHMKLLRHRKSPEATEQLYALACGPDQRVSHYSGCIIDGIRFHTKEREMLCRTQNNGVIVEGDKKGEHILEYYGVLTDILELRYCFRNSIYLFKYDWWNVGNTKTGIHIDQHFTSVNTSQTWYKDDPYVLASQCKQVFYLKDPKFRGEWQVVQKIKAQNVYDVLQMKEAEVDLEVSEGAFQEEDQLADDGVVQHDEQEVQSLHLSRADVEPNHVDSSAIIAPVQLDLIDASFINDDDDDESDDEDDTLMEYCSNDEEPLSTDDDTDIEN